MNYRKISLALCLCLPAIFPVCVWAHDVPKLSNPEENGFSSERLGRITTLFQADIDKGALPGTVVMVVRNGKPVYLQALGFQDREKRLPMKPDTIFRIASMTKPVTTVAVMMLAEEGKIDLLAPVFKYLPEFKEVKVGVEKIDSGSGKPSLSLVAPERPMTVQDLIRHTSGLVYGSMGNSLVHQAYEKANLFDDSQTQAEFVTKLSKLPLAHQPGTVWEYGMSIDVLGRIVEVVSGMPLDRFIEERITRPLGMHDTGFYLTPAQATRLAELQVDPAAGKRPASPDAASLTRDKRRWFSGGGGLLSTAFDYARFCQMLLNGGELDGVRLLSPKTVAMMTSDQLPPGIPRPGFEDLTPSAEMGQSFGLGFAIRTDLGHSPVSGSIGDYFWVGYYGTAFWVDPQEKLFTIMMVQMPFEQAARYRRALRGLVYGALIH
jgi:CubicO group peptidase (beta-lactamase class C family)